MKMDRRRKWHLVVHQELNTVALSQSQLRRRELSIAQDDCPVETGDFTLLPSQSNMKPDWLFGRLHIKAIATSDPLYQAKESQPSQFAIEGLHAVLSVRRCQSRQIASALDQRKQCLLRTVQCSPPLTSSQANWLCTGTCVSFTTYIVGLAPGCGLTTCEHPSVGPICILASAF